MNTKAREALVAAALSGRLQITGRFHREGVDAGDCALGILHELDPPHNPLCCSRTALSPANHVIGLSNTKHGCPVKGCTVYIGEASLVVHLNDQHKWDFLTIARKFPGGEADV